jgi:hypothetical protein
LFENGTTKRRDSSISDEEMHYAVGCRWRLENQCVRLEAQEGIDNVSSYKQNLIEDKELEIGRTSSEMSYGEEMLKEGEVQGSGYYRT